MKNTYQTLQVAESDSLVVLTISRPEALNALNTTVVEEMTAFVAEIQENPDVRCLIITGEGRSFVAGADIAQQQPLDLLEGRSWGQKGSALMRKIETLPFPTIAAVNGFALGGGCELAMACDIIIASEKAKFGQPEVSLGITAGFSGTQRLPRRVGVGMAKELLYSGKIISAQEAKEIGLVNAVYAPEALMDSAKEMAASFMKNAPIAVKLTKDAIDRGLQVDIDTGIAIENELFALCFGTKDQKEGMLAFLEKREAKFENK